MDMNEPLHFGSTTQSGVVTPSASDSGKLLAALCLVVLVLALGFISYWSICTVAYGIESAKLYPPTFSSFEVNLFSLSLQTITTLFGLVLPFFFRRWLTLMMVPFVAAVWLAVTAFEGYHGVLAQHKTATAPAVVAHEEQELAGLSNRITVAANQLQEAYRAKTAAYEMLADDAARGRDETGIARCKGICQENRRKFATATARFAHLALAAAPPPASLPAGADLHALLTDVQHRSSKLAASRNDLTLFFQTLDQSPPPAVLAGEIDAIATAVQRKTQAYQHLHSLSLGSMALNETNQAFAAIAQGSLPATESRLPLVYGLLPAFCVLVLTMMIRACIAALGQGHYGLMHGMADWFNEKIQATILPRVDALSANNFISRARIRTRRWLDNAQSP